MIRLKLILAILVSGLCVTAAQAGDLEITVENVQSANGTLRFALHNAGSDFPSSISPIAVRSVEAVTGRQTVVFDNLPAGTYAVAVYHDENGNEKLDRNFVGIPKEGYGFSRNAASNFGPPEFEQAAINVSSAGGTTAIMLRY